MTVEDIKAAIEQLPEPERLELADWFDAMKNRAWNAEMERDFSPGGRGMRLLEEVEADVREGRSSPCRSALRKPRQDAALNQKLTRDFLSLFDYSPVLETVSRASGRSAGLGI